MVKSKSIQQRSFDLANMTFMIIFMALCIIPVMHVFFASFSDAGWVLSQDGIIWRIKGFNLIGYQMVFANKDIWMGYMNTIIYVGGTTVIGFLLTVLTAYALSRRDALWTNAIMLFIAITMLFNGGMIATYMVITKGLHLYDSRWAIILPASLNAFNLIIVRTAMMTIPASLEESAKLDGAGRITILFRIILPLIKATLATIILFTVIAQWNSWFSASIYLRDRSKYPLQLILKEILVTGDTTNVNQSTAANNFNGDITLYKQLIKYCTIVISTVPIFIFYPFVQKYFESGVMIGAVKG